MNPKCPQCGTTKDGFEPRTQLHLAAKYSKYVGLIIYEHGTTEADTVYCCMDCGCHFRGDGRRVSMLGHILGPDPVHKPITLTGVKKR